jgi:DNA-binding NarL/FixJ family response regulator
MYTSKTFNNQPVLKKKPSLYTLLRQSAKRKTKMLLAHADGAYRREVAQSFHALDIELATVGTACAVHRLVRRTKPAVVFLDARLEDESGYLICAKIKLQHPKCKVVLIHQGEGGEAGRFADFVGADAVLDRGDGVQPLVDQVLLTSTLFGN